ncbi:four and a half LIM domains protein 2-like [Pollicipes pollicipes]|uniref:four and a half LIM domains protein 2-like n=1 Tax=Pollicipes pollicipes TaxID=41117 RepID=UPI00188588B8|nr:four and a half LIM domains protein 2-like [Pollicipes pollicipes]
MAQKLFKPQVAYKALQWHQACFVCCVCHVPLGARTFLPKEQRLYCPRCYEETFAARCRRCDGTITSLGVTYQGDTWHRECFVCASCDQRPYCADCYTRLFAKRCDKCRGPIAREPGTRYSVFQERSWHNACFTCATCGTSLVGRGFIDADGELLCATADCARRRLVVDGPDI